MWTTYVSTILPRPKDHWTTFNKIRRFNKEVKLRFDTMNQLRTWRPFTRKGLPRRFMYKFDALHPSKKGAIRMSQYFAKQMALSRKEHNIPRNKRAASVTIVTKKPRGGYNYTNERVRTRTLFRPVGEYPKEPTYGSNEKDSHKPRPCTVLRRNTRLTISTLRRKMEGKPMVKPAPSRIMPTKSERKLSHTLKMKKKIRKIVHRLESMSDPATKDKRVIQYSEDTQASTSTNNTTTRANVSPYAAPETTPWSTSQDKSTGNQDHFRRPYNIESQHTRWNRPSHYHHAQVYTGHYPDRHRGYEARTHYENYYYPERHSRDRSSDERHFGLNGAQTTREREGRDNRVYRGDPDSSRNRGEHHNIEWERRSQRAYRYVQESSQHQSHGQGPNNVWNRPFNRSNRW